MASWNDIRNVKNAEKALRRLEENDPKIFIPSFQVKLWKMRFLERSIELSDDEIKIVLVGIFNNVEKRYKIRIMLYRHYSRMMNKTGALKIAEQRITLLERYFTNWKCYDEGERNNN